MSTVQEIANAIAKLSEEEIQEIREWLFDRDIANDASNGRLDFLVNEAVEESRAGRAKPL